MPSFCIVVLSLESSESIESSTEQVFSFLHLEDFITLQAFQVFNRIELHI